MVNKDKTELRIRVREGHSLVLIFRKDVDRSNVRSRKGTVQGVMAIYMACYAILLANKVCLT